MKKTKKSTPVVHQGVRMDTPNALQNIASIIKALSARGSSTIEELFEDTKLSIRSLNRYLGHLREVKRVEELGKSRRCLGEKVLYAIVDGPEPTTEKDRSAAIKRRILGPDEWQRGEHIPLAAFWPPRAQAMAG
jgi:hypothetical protein